MSISTASINSMTTLTPTSSFGSSRYRRNRATNGATPPIPPLPSAASATNSTRAALQRAAFMRSRAATRRVEAQESFDSPLQHHQNLSSTSASSSPIDRCRSRSAKAHPAARRKTSEVESVSRKTSLVDATPTTVKTCLRKLSVQFNQNTVVREVRGLLEPPQRVEATSRETSGERARDVRRNDFKKYLKKGRKYRLAVCLLKIRVHNKN